MTDVRVLLADDNEDLRAMLRLSLELAGGFEVVAEAADAATAVALADALRPDVVLVDLVMPGRDQVDVMAEVHANHPDIAVVVLTGWLVVGVRDRRLAGGASGYLVKVPDLMTSLLPALRSAVGQRVGADAER
jgi:DNA-binding NarL/FixJ family response regulator